MFCLLNGALRRFSASFFHPPLSSPLAGEQHRGVYASADQDALLPLLPGHARRQALQELLSERHERLPGQSGRPGPRVEPVHR